MMGKILVIVTLTLAGDGSYDSMGVDRIETPTDHACMNLRDKIEDVVGPTETHLKYAYCVEE